MKTRPQLLCSTLIAFCMIFDCRKFRLSMDIRKILTRKAWQPTNKHVQTYVRLNLPKPLLKICCGETVEHKIITPAMTTGCHCPQILHCRRGTNECTSGDGFICQLLRTMRYTIWSWHHRWKN